jgi:phytol kinase
VNPWLGIALVLAALMSLMCAIRLLDRWARLPAELSRKLLHVSMGLVVLSFPWVFRAQWPVTLLTGIAANLLLTIRFVPLLRDGLGTIVNRVTRPSLGEIYFPLAVGFVFWISDRDKILYCIPILIVTLADATAALIGIAYGKLRYVTSDGLKSAEGSIAFFSIAFLSVHVPLLLFTDIGRPQSLLVATIIGILSMLLEATAWRGLDNLAIPIGAFAFLKLYLVKSVHELIVRLIATILLLVFALSWRRRSSLDDSALIAGALFAYAACMLGGPPWLIGPVLLFLTHVTFWPRAGTRREHSVFAVLAVVSTALVWIGLHASNGNHLYFFAYAVTFGVHLAIICVSRIRTELPAATQARRLAAAIAIGWVLALVQIIGFVIYAHARVSILESMCLTSLLGVAAGGVTFFLFRPFLYSPAGTDVMIHFAGLLTGLMGSLLSLGGETILQKSFTGNFG